MENKLSDETGDMTPSDDLSNLKKTETDDKKVPDASLSQWTIDVAMKKKMIFLRMKAWETDRVERMSRFDGLINPLVVEITDVILQTRMANLDLLKALKEHLRITTKHYRQLKKSAALLRTGGSSALDCGSPSSSPPAWTSQFSNSISGKRGNSKTGAPKFGFNFFTDILSNERNCFFEIYPRPWSQAIAQMHLIQSSAIESEVAYIESEFVSETSAIAMATEEFETKSQLILQSLKETRCRSESTDFDAKRLWTEYEKSYLSNEKTVLSSSVDNLPRDMKDCWLYERRYFIFVLGAVNAKKEEWNTTHKMFEAARTLCDRRKDTVLNSLRNFFFKIMNTNHQITDSVKNTFSFVDPQQETVIKGYDQLVSSQGDNQSETLPSEIKNTTMSFDAYNEINREQLENQDGSDDQPLLKSDLTIKIIDLAKAEIKFPPIPESYFLVKRGIVKRQSGLGLWGSWETGLMVMTWDRFLHMFRSHDDSTPLWSVNLRNVSIKISESDLTIIEIRDKKKMASKTTYVRANTALHAEQWLECLKIGAKGSDVQFESLHENRCLLETGVYQAEKSDLETFSKDPTDECNEESCSTELTSF